MSLLLKSYVNQNTLVYIYINYFAIKQNIKFMIVAPAETTMWESSSAKNGQHKLTDEEINNKYEQGQQRILTEMNREKLPSFAESLEKANYMMDVMILLYLL